jgi:hypothetical protein
MVEGKTPAAVATVSSTRARAVLGSIAHSNAVATPAAPLSSIDYRIVS